MRGGLVLAHGARAALLVVGVCVLLSGCTEDDNRVPTPPPSPGTSSEPGPTGDGASSDPPSEPVPPVLPTAATRQSTSGAKAFVRYYIDVLNYSHKSDSSKLLRSISTSKCLVCTAIADRIDSMARQGGGQIGGEWIPGAMFSLPPATSHELVFALRLQIGPGTVRRSETAATERIRPDDVLNIFHVAWHKESWILTNFEAT